MNIIDTLFELLNEYQVEIPIVQRDYAQGRSDKHSTSVRKNLLQDIRTAIEGGGVLDLNFIYGKTEGYKFIPLDGQQRLTTLFLVHLYAFATDETKTPLLKKFTYETRTSSRKFLGKLIEHRATVFTSLNKPSEEITDSDWYQTSWDYDPTVQSVKVVLDNIAEILGGVEGLCEKLSDQGNEPVRFSFLPMDELGMEDSLYIKMNARGRMLTPFENYKARLISQVQKLYEHKELSIKPHDFERCLDGDWTDLFWKRRRNDFDTSYKDFFDVLFTNIANLPEDCGYVASVDFVDITSSMVESAYYTLNYLCRSDCQREVSNLIFRCLGQRPSYPQRVMFYAVSAYMLQAKENVMEKPLNQWLRIIGNLTNNTNEQTIGRSENFGAAVQSISALSLHWSNLLEYFAEQTINLKIFAPPQIEEEQIKAVLMLRSSDFSAKILNAELHNYFSGQIRSALLAAGITHEISKGVDDVQLKEMMHLFDLYWNKIAALFADKGPIFGILLRQALLVQKDYTLKTGGYHSFGVDNPNDPVSLKSLFADTNQTDLIRNLLDSLPTSAKDDIKQSLGDTISNALIPENDWRYCFIKHPRLFAFMSKQYMRIYKGTHTLIVKNKATNGYNFEVFTFTLHQILGSKKSEYPNVYGSYGDYYMTTKVLGKRAEVRFKNGNFVISDESLDTDDPKSILFQTESEPLSEVVSYMEKNFGSDE
jgi:hypothetical protein